MLPINHDDAIVDLLLQPLFPGEGVDGPPEAFSVVDAFLVEEDVVKFLRGDKARQVALSLHLDIQVPSDGCGRNLAQVYVD